MKKISLILLVLVAALALAQDQITLSPQSIIIEPIPNPVPAPTPTPIPVPSLDVDVWLNKRLHNGTPTYYIGERLEIGVRTNQDAYVYLFNLHSDGTVVRIFPNRFENHNYLRANQTKYLPAKNSRYRFTVDGPVGFDKVVAVASKTRLNTSALANFRSERDFFAQGSHSHNSFARSLSIIVTPIENSSWVTDVTNFYIRY